MSTPRKRRYARTRQAILDAALALIRENGADNLSLREVARRIDYSPAGLYEYFGSKDDLLYALVQEGHHRLTAMMEAVDSALAPDEALVALCLAYVDFAQQYPAFFSLMFTSFASKRVSAATPSSGAFGVLVAAVGRAVEAGLIQAEPDYDAEAIAYSCWAFAHGMATLQLTHLRQYDADFRTIDRTAVTLFVRSLNR